jgi:hypothetical protein
MRYGSVSDSSIDQLDYSGRARGNTGIVSGDDESGLFLGAKCHEQVK